jgi:hypothetical protein
MRIFSTCGMEERKVKMMTWSPGRMSVSPPGMIIVSPRMTAPTIVPGGKAMSLMGLLVISEVARATTSKASTRSSCSGAAVTILPRRT